MHEGCIHYQLVGGQALVVDKDDWYDYCIAEVDETSELVSVIRQGK